MNCKLVKSFPIHYISHTKKNLDELKRKTNMKKLLLFSTALLGFAGLNAQTITKDDLKWTIGNNWPSKVNTVDSSSMDLSSGTGKTWDFSGYTSGSDDTIKIIASTKADLRVSSNFGDNVDYKSLSGNYSLAGIATYSTDDPTSGHMGLPHTQGGSWTASSKILAVLTLNITGTVVASGSVTIPWGTYNAVLVKEELSGVLNQTTYYWETAEHGRVAAYAYEKEKLLVMQSTNFTVGTSQVEPKALLKVYPNPAKNLLNIESSAGSATITLTNALGAVVKTANHNGGPLSIDVTDLNKGLYFVQVNADQEVTTQSVVIE